MTPSRQSDDRIIIDLSYPLPSESHQTLTERTQYVVQHELSRRFLQLSIGIQACVLAALGHRMIVEGFTAAIINLETGEIGTPLLIGLAWAMVVAFYPISLGAWRFRRANGKRISETKQAVHRDPRVEAIFQSAIQSKEGLRQIDCEMLIPLAKLAAHARANPSKFQLIE